MTVQERYLELLKEVHDFAARCGRDPGQIKIIAVSKGRPADEIITAFAAGCRDFGENRLDEAFEKMENAPQGIFWHFIGTLQSKKVNKAIGRFSLIHSVDSIKLAQKISEAGEKAETVSNILLQANTSGEDTKHGSTPQEWKERIRELLELPAVNIQGLMTMAPYTQDEGRIRACFQDLSKLRYELEDIAGRPFPHLSMGMTNDYRIAIQEGATLLRIGSLLFEGS